MHRTLMLRSAAMAVVATCFLVNPAAADLEAARAAWARGDHAETLAALNTAAENGDPVGQYELALMHLNGFGVPQDARAAAVWFRRAAENGHAEGQFQYGSMVYRGRGVVQDHRAAARWFLDAAKQGHAEAQLNLGFMYERGDGVPQNDIQAHKWMNIAASRFGDGRARERALAVAARDRIAQRLSPLHLRIAHRLASEWPRQEALSATLTPLN